MGANEPELKPEFIEKMERIAKQKSIRVDDFAKRYGLKGKNRPHKQTR